MFATSGYFRGVPCPFFASGLCERPYCHFRHVKPDDRDTEANALPKVTSQLTDNASTAPLPGNSSLLSMVGSAIKQVQREIESLPGGGVAAGAAIYRPSPIVRPGAAVAKPLVGARRVTIPEYNPTPIKLLKKQASKPSPKDDRSMKYDPATNFSANLPSSVKKRPSIEPTDTSPKKAKLQESGDEIEAKFSDDDAEESGQDVEEKDSKEEATNDSVKATDVKANEKGSNTTKETVVIDKSKMNDKAIDKIKVNDKAPCKVTENVAKDKSKSKVHEKFLSKAKETFARDKSKESNENKSKHKNDVESISDKQENGSNKNIFDLLDTTKNKKSPKAKILTEGSDKENGDTHVKDSEMKDISQSVVTKGDKELKSKDSSKNVSSKIESQNKTSSRHLSKSDGSNGELSDSSSKSSDKHGHKSKDKHSSGEKKAKKDATEVSSHGKSEHSKLKEKCKSDKDKKSHKNEKSAHRKHRSSSSEKPHHYERSSSTEIHSSHGKDKTSGSDKPAHRKERVSSSEKSDYSKVKVKTERSLSKDNSDKSHKRDRSSDPPKSSIKKERTSSTEEISHRRDRSSVPPKSSIKKERTSSTEETSSQKSSHKSSSSLKSSKSHHTSSKTSSSKSSSKSQKSVDKTKASKSPSSRRLSNGRKISASDLFGSSDESDCEVLMMAPPPNHNNPKESDIIRLSSESESDDDNDFFPVGDKDASSDEEQATKKKSPVVNHSSPSPVAKKRPAEDDPLEDLSVPVKKRVAHQAQGAMQANMLKKRAAPSQPAVARPSPAQVMANRLKEIQQQAREAKERLMARRNSNLPTSPPGRTRVAHLPKPMSPTKSPEQAPTPCGTQDKVKPGKRKAHVPSEAVLKRPTIPPDSESKVPNAVRQRYLNLFIDTCLKIYGNESDAFERALTEERVAAERSSSKQVYLNVAVNVVKKLRSEMGSSGINIPGAHPRVQSHSATIAGPRAANTSVQRTKGPKAQVQFSSSELYEKLCSYILTLDQLVENGFPQPVLDEPGKTVITYPEGRKPKLSTNSLERICCRCGSQFAITSEGDYVNMDECMFHWGRSFKRRVNGTLENRYTCCQSGPGTMGCSVCMGHVHEQNKYEDLSDYAQTSAGTPPPDGNYGVFALDCEMVYTTAGSELARVTVVNHDLEPVYEQLVLPSKPVIDYNTRFSGLTAKTLKGVTTTIKDVQNHLLHLFSEDTILVGHSLESDLVALKMIHSTVVDTSVVFPHRLGPPYKRALKNLSGELLQKIIQEDEGGHDSLEDASAAMELMLYKLRQDAKLNKSRRS